MHDMYVACVCTGASRGQKMALYSLKLELRVTGSKLSMASGNIIPTSFGELFLFRSSGLPMNMPCCRANF